MIKYKTKEDLLKYSLLCNTRTEFQKKYSGAYQTARNKGIMDEICSHMITKSYSIPQLILKQITESLFKMNSKYNNLIDFIKNDYNIYNHCYINGLSYLYDHLYRRKKWSYTELCEIVDSCKTIKELRVLNNKAYNTIRKYHKNLLIGLKKNNK